MNKVIVSNLIPIVFFMSFFICACSAQTNNSPVKELASHTENKENRIHSKESSEPLAKHIFDIFEDSKGNLWFGTGEKGVAQYNGTNLTYLNTEDGLCGKTVANITEDNNGIIWFGTYGDMCLYDSNAQKDKFVGFEKDKEGVPHLGWGWKSVRTDANGEIWVNSHHGMFQYVDAKFVEFKVPGVEHSQASFCNTPGSISMDFIDSKGNMWFGTDGDGVYVYDGTSFKHLTTKDGLTSNNITSLAEDKHGNIWFACRNGLNSEDLSEGGVCSYDGSSFTEYPDYKGLHHNNIHTVYSDNSNNVWIGAPKVGVYKYDGKAFTFYTEPKEVIHTDTFNITGLQSILEDSKGTIWMGFSGGLFKLDGEKLLNVKKNGPWD